MGNLKSKYINVLLKFVSVEDTYFILAFNK